MADRAQDIRENLQEVMAGMKSAAEKSGRDIKDIQLVAVTKTFPVEDIRHLTDLGVVNLAENKVQEILAKHEFLPDTAKWHLIGHLQTNKVKYIIDKVCLIHSLDRLELAKEIEKRAAAADICMPCLIQVNIAEDDSKYGLHESEVWDFCNALKDYPHIQVRGLMTIGPFVDKEEIRPVFARLRELSQELAAKIEKNALNYLSMQELSMGMSNDYDIAIEEGATMVRVGSKLFGARTYR